MTDDDSGDLGRCPAEADHRAAPSDRAAQPPTRASARCAGADTDPTSPSLGDAPEGAVTDRMRSPTSTTATSTTPTRDDSSDRGRRRPGRRRGRRSAHGGGVPCQSVALGAARRPVDDLDSMTREEITHRIKKLDDRERFLALTSAPLGVVVGILLTAFTLHLNPPLHLHGKVNPKHVSESLILLEGGARILLSGIVVACRV